MLGGTQVVGSAPMECPAAAQVANTPLVSGSSPSGGVASVTPVACPLAAGEMPAPSGAGPPTARLTGAPRLLDPVQAAGAAGLTLASRPAVPVGLNGGDS